MSAKMRQRVERMIIRRALLDLLHAGFLLNVDNGGDDYELDEPSRSIKEILSVMFASDADLVVVHHPGERNYFGWVHFIHGNGCDVLSDHSSSIREWMFDALDLAEQYS